MRFPRFAERAPGKQPNRGYLAACPRCGDRVVHSDTHMIPMHSHRLSEVCQVAAEKRARAAGGSRPTALTEYLERRSIARWKAMK